MILRKPYAFLIKHFKLIHALLTGLLIFIYIWVSNLYSFFDKYIQISDHLNSRIDPSIKSIPWYMYLSILLAVGIFFSIYILMKKKDKPTKFYAISIAFYIILFGTVVYSGIQLHNLVGGTATLVFFKMARDILQFLKYLQYIFVFFSLIRTLGFDLKSFNFQSDLKELSIGEEDNAEFEVEIGIDSADIKTKFRRFIRMFKYFVQENKKILIIIAVALVSFFGVRTILDITVYNRIYREKETVSINDLKIKVLHSYELTKNYNDRDISEEKYVYYVVKLNIKNETDSPQRFNIENLRLKAGNDNYYGAIQNKYSYFTDLGEGYDDQTIKSGVSKDYIVVFRVDKKYKSSGKMFEILRKRSLLLNGFSFTRIRISPENIDETEEIKTSNLKEELSMTDTIIGDIIVKIEEFGFEENAYYTYEEIINDRKYTFKKVIEPNEDDGIGRIFLKIKLDLKFNNLSDKKLEDKFFANFAKVRYKIDDEEYYSDVELKEYTVDKEHKFLVVSDRVQQAKEINIDFIIRNRKYIYKLK